MIDDTKKILDRYGWFPEPYYGPGYRECENIPK